jgi:predicted outer membrane protein
MATELLRIVSTMASPLKLRHVVAAILTVGGAHGQSNAQLSNYDQYDPNMRRNPVTFTPSGNPANVTPSLMDMGFGTDQANIGPFVTSSDKQFAQATTIRALVQLRLAEAAARKSDRADVRAVAQRMTDDYTRWGDGMRRVSAYLNIKVPSEIDARRQGDVDRILALSGAEFDQAYLKEVLKLQRKALTITQYEAENAGVTGFRHWAGVMVPALQTEIRAAHEALSGAPLAASRE